MKIKNFPKRFFYVFLFIFINSCEPTNYCDSSDSFDSQLTDDTSTLFDGYTESDSNVHDIVCNAATMDYDTDTYFYPNFPLGPYGFKETICWHVDSGYLMDDGDTIHNLCLPSSDGSTHCLGDFKNGILFVHVATTNSLSVSSGRAIKISPAAIKDKCNLDSIFISILISENSTSPILEDAKSWRERTRANHLVLYDVNNKWADRMINDYWPSSYPRNSPFVFAVDTKNMKILNTFIGWDFQYNMYSDDWYEFVCDILTSTIN